MRAEAAGVSDVGRERDHNEDRYALLPEVDLWVVCDGMGGHQCGEVASEMAIGTISDLFRAASSSGSPLGLGTRLRAAVEEANRCIHQRAASSPTYRGMGTTVVAAALSQSERKLFVVHAGDSRCYRFRDGVLEQVTRDHSLLEDALRTRPDITREELSFLPSNVITRALGVDVSVDPDVNVRSVEPGDVYLLCSDGLHGFVDDARIQAILSTHAALTDASSALVDQANANGGGDNVTALLIRIERTEDDELPPWTRVTASLRPDGPMSQAAPSTRLPSFIEDAPTEADEPRAVLIDEDFTPVTSQRQVPPIEEDRTPYTAGDVVVRNLVEEPLEEEPTLVSLNRDFDLPPPPALDSDVAVPAKVSPPVLEFSQDEELTPPSLHRDSDLPPPPVDPSGESSALRPTPSIVVAPAGAAPPVHDDDPTPPSLVREVELSAPSTDVPALRDTPLVGAASTEPLPSSRDEEPTPPSSNRDFDLPLPLPPPLDDE